MGVRCVVLTLLYGLEREEMAEHPDCYITEVWEFCE